MNHAAIDLGGKESQICIRQPDGTIIEERKVPTRKLAELMATWAPSRVVMETSAEAFKVADAALAVPTPEHYLPLLYVLGTQQPGDPVAVPVTGFELGTIGMTSLLVGAA